MSLMPHTLRLEKRISKVIEMHEEYKFWTSYWGSNSQPSAVFMWASICTKLHS